MKVLRPGTAIRVLTNGRLRHTIVKTVTSQTSVGVRLGQPSNPTNLSATRGASTKTRAVMFTAGA